MIAGETEALPSLLRGIGYETLALHPGYRWFYNRQNVYRNLGFTTAIFEDAFAREAYRDTYISEAATYDMLLSLLDTHFQERTSPLFAFCLTIQNHAAYQDRFLPEGVQTFTPTVPMDDTQRNILSNYFAGIAEADAELARLAAYLDALEEPAIVVYFGDHIPALSDAIYDLLIPGAQAEEGSLEQATRLYTVPYLIWPNAAAREAGVLALDAGDKESALMSSNYLGAYLLELLGMEGLSPFFRFAGEVRKEFPVLMENIAYQPDGSTSLAATEAARGMLQWYRYWAYQRATSN